jgi:hypothetical protein
MAKLMRYSLFGMFFSSYRKSHFMDSSQTPADKTPKRKKGETLHEKVQRHLKDKNDIITEEDLRDIVVGGITPTEEKESEELADEFSNSKKKQITTPWDILDEKDSINPA